MRFESDTRSSGHVKYGLVIVLVYGVPLCLRLQVYDVTKFADDHPGGVEVMQASAGKQRSDSVRRTGGTEGLIDESDEYMNS